jgi:ATP-dependent Zn protease
MTESNWVRRSFVYLMVLIAIGAIVVVFFRPSDNESTRRPISDVIADAKAGHVDRIVVKGDIVDVTTDSGLTYESRKETGVSIYVILESNDVDTSTIVIEVKEESGLGDWLGLLLNFLPILVFVGLIWGLMRRRDTGQ